MNKMAPVILAAADRYRLEDLKTWCDSSFRQMSSKNCFEQMFLDTHHPAEGMVKLGSLVDIVWISHRCDCSYRQVFETCASHLFIFVLIFSFFLENYL